MKKTILLIFLGLLAVVAAPAHAAEITSGTLKISDPWVRLIIKTRPGAEYMTIHNTGNTPDRLISATSPVAARVEIHTHIMKNNIMKMRPVEAVDIPANSMVAFKSGGYHLMIFGLKAGVKSAGEVPLTLVFEKAGEIKIIALIKSLMKKKMKHTMTN